VLTDSVGSEERLLDADVTAISRMVVVEVVHPFQRRREYFRGGMARSC
jgi:hypothetical protein